MSRSVERDLRVDAGAVSPDELSEQRVAELVFGGPVTARAEDLVVVVGGQDLLVEVPRPFVGCHEAPPLRDVADRRRRHARLDLGGGILKGLGHPGGGWATHLTETFPMDGAPFRG